MRATISEVRNGLSAYLRRVKRGESVIIVDRSTPVARLVPIEAAGVRDEGATYALHGRGGEGQTELEDEAKLTRLEAAGVVVRDGTGSPLQTVLAWPRLPGTGLVDAILDARREDGYR
ncbi:MAG: type II toxin-antitoxin system prevent-host-death family antitoxin [Gammaproteobacteria bacterium]|nr:type II toxin-antitoxin system prevent-host-death family antitoxin [Gammaproteobacteria bacterium]